jgi:methionine-rich copper-binding protein CopC
VPAVYVAGFLIIFLPMTKLLRYAALGAIVALGTAMVHNHLVKSTPAEGEKLAISPKEVRLWFNERPEIPFTSVTLMRADSTKVATIKAMATADSMVASAPLAQQLPAGKYLVAWRTASSDGHAIRGMFGFTITP